MALAPGTAYKLYDLVGRAVKGTFNAVAGSGKWAVDAAETGIGKVKPGFLVPEGVARKSAEFVAGSTVVGGVAGGVVGAVGEDARELATKVAPDMVPDALKDHDDGAIGTHFGENFIPSAVSGALFIPRLAWDVAGGVWNWATGKAASAAAGGTTTKTEPPATGQKDAPVAAVQGAVSPAAQKPGESPAPASAPAQTPAQTQAAQIEAQKKAEQDKKARADAEANKKSDLERAAQQSKQLFEEKTRWGRDSNGDLNIWRMVDSITEMVNSPGVPNGFKMAWNWLAGVLKSDTGRSIMMAIGALAGIKTTMASVQAIAAGKPQLLPGIAASHAGGLAIGAAGLSDPDYPGAPRTKTGLGIDYARHPENDPYAAGGRRRGLDVDATSTRDFNSGASGEVPPRQNPDAEAPVLHYRGTRLSQNFTGNAEGMAITPVAPPVTQVAKPRQLAQNDFEYRIDGSS